MKIIFDKYRCPGWNKESDGLCGNATFEVRFDPTEFDVRRGYVNPDGYKDFFYGRCLACGYNLNLSMAILQEYGTKDPYEERWSGPYPCLALERGFVDTDPKDGKQVIRYAYECSMKGRRQKIEAIIREARGKK